MLNLLLVEDDIDLATAVVEYFELESINCDHAANGVAGLKFIEENTYHAIILDLNLPRMDGISVCKAARNKGIDTPIIMLTARDSLDDKLLGFKSGTDDYLVKPFAIEELLVRVQALAGRRSGQVQVLSVADLQLDLTNKRASRGEHQIKLSPTTWKIAEVLVRASPNALSRSDLMQAVWGDEQPDSNSLKVHIYNLRKQLEQEGKPSLLHTIPGHGFAIRSS